MFVFITQMLLFINTQNKPLPNNHICYIFSVNVGCLGQIGVDKNKHHSRKGRSATIAVAIGGIVISALQLSN